MHATAEIEDILDANRRLGTVADLKTAIRKTREELDEFEAELDKGDDAKALSELGDTLLAVHLLAGRYAREKAGSSPWMAADEAAVKVLNRLGVIEKLVTEGTALPDAVKTAKAQYR